MLVDGTMAGDIPGRECPCEDGIWRPRAGETRPGWRRCWTAACWGKRCPPLMLPGSPFRWCPLGGGSSSVGAANPAGSDGPVVAGGPVGPCGMFSPLFHDALGPLEHSVLEHAGPVGRHVAVGTVGPDETLLGLDPLAHSGLDHADPAGQRAAVVPVGLLGTLSPLDCHPAGPYVAGGPVGPDEAFQVLDSLKHSDPDHTDPAGQHAVFQDVLEPLEHSVLEMTLDGGHSEMTIEEEPLVGAPDSGLMDGMSHLEPLEHSVLNYFDSDNGSITDFDGSMSGEYCVVMIAFV